MDLNIDHYSIDELTTILDLDIVDRNTILQATEQQIDKTRQPDVIQFYKDVQKKLLETLPSENVGRTFITEVKRGTINPDIKNTVTRIINIDSSTRLLSNIENYTTDNFICELADPLLNVVSISLLSIEIPISWYTFALTKGTTTFVLAINGNTGPDTYSITIPDGNYTVVSLLEQIKSQVYAAGLTSFDYVYNQISGRVRFTMLTNFTIIWYDKYNTFDTLLNATLNSNLGKILGFILPISLSREVGSTYFIDAESILDVSGTKYIMLMLKDFLQNRLNHNIIGMNTLPKLKSKMPSYYSYDLPQYKTGTSNIAVIPHSFLSQKKQATINAINVVTLPPKISFCESANMFAKIPVKRLDWAKTSDNVYYQTVPDCGPVKLMVDMSGPLQLNIREYFGPVTISSLEFSLYDDKGKLLGLNGMDWSCSLLVKSTYQY
jgi:hypothetical protein